MFDAGAAEHGGHHSPDKLIDDESQALHQKTEQAVLEHSEDERLGGTAASAGNEGLSNRMSRAEESELQGGEDAANGSADAEPAEWQHRWGENDGDVPSANPFVAPPASGGATPVGGSTGGPAAAASDEQPSGSDAMAMGAATAANGGETTPAAASKTSPPADAPATDSHPKSPAGEFAGASHSPEPVDDTSGDPSMCPYADAETVQKLSARVLNTIATGVVLRGLTPGDAIAELRTVLLDTAGSNQPSKKGPQGLVLLHTRLEKLEAKRSLSAHFLTHQADKVAARARELDDHPVCRHSVRQRLAVELVKHFDRAKEWHCGCDISVLTHAQREHHSMSCIYRPVGCVYPGCTAIFSARFEGAHDSMCEYKTVPCHRQCGLVLPRREMAAHMEGPCAMKPVHCPYRAIGCPAPGLVQGKVESHVAECCDAHLRLSVNCILYQQKEIADLLAARQTDREAAAAAGFHSISELVVGVTDLRKRLDTFETKNASSLQKQSKASKDNARRVEDAMASRVAKLEKELRKLSPG